MKRLPIISLEHKTRTLRSRC